MAGIAPARMLNIIDPMTAYAFNDAAAERLRLYDQDMRKEQATLIAIEVGRLFGGKGLDALNDSTNGVVDNGIAPDGYGAEFAEVW